MSPAALAGALAGLANRWPDGSCRCCGFPLGSGHWYRCQHWQPPRKYRWLTEGHTYTYGPKLGKGDDSRRGAGA